MKITDESGYVRVFLSSVVLFVNHGMRDYLITGIPRISSNNLDVNRELWKEINNFIGTFKLLVEDAHTNDVRKGTGDSILNTEEGWTSSFVGGALSIVHWGWLISIVAASILIQKVSIKPLLVASLILSGIISLFTELASNNASGLLLIRGALGLSQGLCYPVVYVILEEVNAASFAPYFLVFLAPWLGSAFGVLLGWTKNPFTAAYVFGSMSVIAGIAMVFFPLPLESEEKPQKAWRECLRSWAVWTCVFLQMGVVWTVHLFLVGLSFTLQFRQDRHDLLWMVFVALLVGGIACRLVAMVAMNLLRNHFFTPLNRRRFIISLGSVIIVASLITIGASGVDHTYVLFAMTCFAFCGGVSLALVGIRANLHDLGPLFPTPFLIFGSIGATFGAGAASLLFPIMAQIDSIEALTPVDNMDNGPWMLAYMLPSVVIVIGCVAHLFLVSVIPLPHQTLIASTNGNSDLNTIANKQDLDARSFKSIKSAISFKSAVSRQRTRTISFKTVDDNTEVDMRSVQDSVDGECQSIQQDEDAKDELRSIKSGAPSFKSATENPRKSVGDVNDEVIISAQDLDRTSAWLSTHHDKGVKTNPETSLEKEIVNKNILLALQW